MSSYDTAIIDVSYLSYRAFFTTGELSYQGRKTGVLYGVLREIDFIRNRFSPKRIIFAFDRGHDQRTEIWPEYKKRNPLSAEEQQSRRKLKAQISDLREWVLEELGFNNVFYAHGCEADDVIAKCAQWMDLGEIVIVSADRDLYQLIMGHVHMYNPTSKKIVTLQSFYKEWEINPSSWVMARALSGDASDNIPGIKGIGLKTAIKHINGKLSENSKARQSIVSNEGLAIATRNLKLMVLPIAGCPNFKLRKDNASLIRWRRVCKELGFHTIAK